jgi:ribosomal protein S18 acetylase RimI-like enzyme
MLISVTEQASFAIRAPRDDDTVWIQQQLRASRGSTIIVTRGQAHDAACLPALLAVRGDDIVGLATFRFADGDCEFVTLDALQKGLGIGSALLVAVAREAADHGCPRLWLITTNDNLDAMRFYQRRRMRLAALHRGAVDGARRLKPSIPSIGKHGIPIHDELEFELRLAENPRAR